MGREGGRKEGTLDGTDGQGQGEGGRGKGREGKGEGGREGIGNEGRRAGQGRERGYY